MKITHHTKSKEETQRIAEAFAQSLKGGEVIALVGEMGAGKTTFTQGLVRALGTTATVKSPTFAVLNEYPTAHPRIRRVAHADFYRFTTDAELRALELEEYLNPETVFLAEWPSKINNNLPGLTHIITITASSENERVIEIEFLTSP